MLEVNFNPFPEITTDRLQISRIKDNHAEALLQLRSNEETMQYIDKEKSKTILEIQALIKRIDNDITTGDGITWCISLKENPAVLIGSIGFGE